MKLPVLEGIDTERMPHNL